MAKPKKIDLRSKVRYTWFHRRKISSHNPPIPASLLIAHIGEVFSPRTMRQTQVIVIPSNEDYQNSFHKFNALIESINQARRNARDYVTEVSLEKLDERMYGEGERDWRYD
jgi:hypothetical protein